MTQINLKINLIILSLVASFSSTYFCHVQSPSNFTNSSSSVIALILARGGSKGIKLKNIQQIDGVTLLGIALTEIQQTSLFESIWVSTDHEDIALEAEKYSANVFWRDPKYAQDKSTSIDAVQEFLRNHSHIQNLALIQCTSPFISHRYLQEAFEKFSFHRDCVFAAVRSYKLRWERDDSKNVGKIVPINFNYRKRPRRQDWSGELIEAGMFYFAKRKLLDDHLFQNENCDIVEIKNEDSMEIDTPHDLELARLIHKNFKSRELIN